MTWNRTDSDRTSDGRIITVNGGSSSIKFAVFAACAEPTRMMTGLVERIGSAQANLVVADVDGELIERVAIDGGRHDDAVQCVTSWLANRLNGFRIEGIGHRIVHGGLKLVEHELVTVEVLQELRAAQPLDLTHLPREIALLEAFGKVFAGVPQIACFDTAFHRDLPRVAKLLPIPRRYDDAGIRRMGFHGLSYTFLMSELRRVAGATAADGRVILAHLGSGASLAAVRDGKPVDTSMGFTPTGGLMMGTRPGDLDPGVLLYLMRQKGQTPTKMDELINQQSGLAGVSETGSDLRDLVARSGTDVRAAEAVELFCYQAKKWIGSFTAVLGGLDTLVFAGGIGEHSSQIRDAICRGLDFFGLRLDSDRNARSADLISADDSRVIVRVIRTDEEIVIARTVGKILRAPRPT